ncbi:MAG: hemolysin III family protein [Oscillospiraceae bacterium]|nr:hemolysin III family protein [Oscillospiraceae bacterium]
MSDLDRYIRKIKAIRDYTFGEEVGNAITHGAMALITLGGIAPASISVFSRLGTLAAVGTSIFMCSIFLMFMFSSIYHSMAADTKHKVVLQILDHIFIYVAIAGTYTPIALSVIGGAPGIVVASLQWGMVLFGVLYKSLSRRSIPKVSLTIYLVMGWSILFVSPMFFRNASLGMQLLLFGGGVFYSGGAYFYKKKEKMFFHMVWHLCVNLGALCHFLGLLMFL